MKAAAQPVSLASKKTLTLQNARKAGHMSLQTQECRNMDVGVSDITGDNCKSWYDNFPGSCTESLYKDDDFDAEDLCCVCGGGQWTNVDDGHDNCDNYDWSTDSTGDSCASWYDNFPESCGNYDTDDFDANFQCCSCGGGMQVQPLVLAKDKPSALSLKAQAKPVSLATKKAVTLQNARKTGHFSLQTQECRNMDVGVSDVTGDNCKSWYDNFPGSCTESLYKDDDFDAEDLCCVCGGGQWTNVDDGHDNCDNYDWSTDSTGDSCSAWYDSFPESCGNYDTDDFDANFQCCSCGGGMQVQPLNLKADVKPMNLADRKALILAANHDSTTGTCWSTDFASTGDITNDGCSWYNEYPDSCGLFDDDDFFANTMCCSCGGGNRQAVDGHPFCDNTNFDFRDTTGDDCSWYDNYPETCGQFNTDDFDSNEMCCACQGGYQMVCEDTSLGFTDDAGNSCSYYEDQPVWCGVYDDDNFRASEMCCACGGGSIPSTCGNDNPDALTDSDGDRCDWYESMPFSCGNYDDDDFIASERCCICGGGKQVPIWPPANVQLKGVTRQNAQASNYDFAVAVFSAFATLAVAGWSLKTALTKRIQSQAQNDVFERLM